MFDPDYHVPVLLNEVITNLFQGIDQNDECIMVDLTFGGGGHSFAALEKYRNLSIIGFDQDRDAIEHGLKFSHSLGFQDRVSLIHQNFEKFGESLIDHPWLKSKAIKIMLADLGVSSHQFDTASRGFSFRHDGPLDMRMDQNVKITAADMVNQFPEDQLADILFKYGGETLSRRIAKRIVEHRKENGPLQKTSELETLIFHVYPKKFRYGRTHPATKSFQALRIAVNSELEVLTSLLEEFKRFEIEKCRFGIITFHSLEDRIVKHFFRDSSKHDKKYQVITKSPITASEEEIKSNSRARSAKLRVLEIGNLESYVKKYKEKETI